MELELEQDVIVCYEVVGQASTCQEETQEAIVPDACPDILRLADVCAQAFVSRWEVREGQAVVIGYIQASVLYIPEFIIKWDCLRITTCFTTITYATICLR